MSERLAIRTARLEMVAATAPMMRASLERAPRFGELLDAIIPGNWPPVDLLDVEENLTEMIEENPGLVGWMTWYGVRLPTDDDPRRVLIGNVGIMRTDADTSEIGYATLPGFEGRGYAHEGMRAVLDWALAHDELRGVIAHTFEHHHASVRILEKLGLTCVGVSPNDADAPDSDRQGRGRLMRYALWRRTER